MGGLHGTTTVGSHPSRRRYGTGSTASHTRGLRFGRGEGVRTRVPGRTVSSVVSTSHLDPYPPLVHDCLPLVVASTVCEFDSEISEIRTR